MANFQQCNRKKVCLILSVSRLTNEVCDRFERLFLSHNESNLLLLSVSHELGVADAPFFPLLVTPSEQLGSDLHEALEVLLPGRQRHLGQIDL